ncbi:hypothetical protein GMDG_07500 [Pseudogymnoascus destructans 20631-21]|uniref:CCHC-type domain-containing protein n=1 Tax=Pseudogymnoascus destructans (strain ATCC MYA-4855 / 20631-21) TaxID=658429 RepID=L8FXV1_PSED2|nr:hypothetical protein GMDG_07500 [Pseudogymnoascus destructans 20631-21]
MPALLGEVVAAVGRLTAVAVAVTVTDRAGGRKKGGDGGGEGEGDGFGAQYGVDNTAGDDTGSNVGLKGKVATEPTIEAPQAHLSDKLKIAFPDTFHGDRKKLKSFIIHTELWMAFNAKHFNKEVEQHATLTNWGDEAICDQFYAGLKDHVKDEISRSDKPDDLREMIELAQKIDNRHYKRQLEKKGGPPSQDWTQKRRQTKSHWPQPMELDATFKPNGKPHNPNKERQFQERLCFNCNKPGHIARNCRQSKKGNGGRKYGKQLNATWQGQGGCKAPQGQLCATLKGK